jgi:WD40 repeat protein
LILLFPRLANAQYWSALPPVSANSAYDVSFSQDEKFVYYLSSESGMANVWRVPVKGGASQQITKFADAPVVRAMHMLGRPFVVYMRGNAAGDTNYHLYRSTDDGTGSTIDLTPFGAGVRSTMLGASYNGQFIYYTANKENLAKLDVYRYDNNQNLSQLDLPNDKDYKVMAWSRDHAKLLVQDPKDESLSFFDIETSDRQPLVVPATGEHFSQALITSDNHGIILVKQTAAGAQVVHADIGSSTWTNDESGDVMRVDLSANGKYRIIVHLNGTITVQNSSTKEPVALGGVPIAMGIAAKENLIAYVTRDAGGVKRLSLYNVEKKTTVELATIK